MHQHTNNIIIVHSWTSMCSGEILWPAFVCLPSSVIFFLNIMFSEIAYCILTNQTSQEWYLGSPLSTFFKRLSLVANVGHRVKTQVSKRQIKNITSKTPRPRAFIFGIKHHLEIHYQSCLNTTPGIKIEGSRLAILHWIIPV